MCVKMQGNINKGVPDNGEWLALLTQGIAFAQLLGDAGWVKGVNVLVGASL